LDDDRRLELRGLEPAGIFVSVRSGEGIDELLARIAELLPHPEIRLELLIPYDRGELVALAHRRARVLDTTYEQGGTRLHLLATEVAADQLRAALAQPVG